MNFHMIGEQRERKKGIGNMGTSLAVAQFVEFARGERVRQDPANLFRVEAVRAEEHYCLGCFGVHWFDVVYGKGEQGKGGQGIGGQGIGVRGMRCRSCGREVMG